MAMMDTRDIKGHLMRQVPRGVIRRWVAQKGARHENTCGRGAQGLPVTVAMTEGRAADCEAACPLMEGMDAEALLAGGVCNPQAIPAHCKATDMEAVIPLKCTDSGNFFVNLLRRGLLNNPRNGTSFRLSTMESLLDLEIGMVSPLCFVHGNGDQRTRRPPCHSEVQHPYFGMRAF